MLRLFFWPEAWGGVVTRALVITGMPVTFLCRRAANAAANTQPPAACVACQWTPGPLVFVGRMQEIKQDLRDIQTEIKSSTNGFPLIPI